MNYISTTDLRTKSSHIVSSLLSGESLYLVHRSRVVGEIKPATNAKKGKTFNAKKFLAAARELNLPKLSYKEREKRYRQYMIERHG